MPSGHCNELLFSELHNLDSLYRAISASFCAENYASVLSTKNQFFNTVFQLEILDEKFRFEVFKNFMILLNTSRYLFEIFHQTSSFRI